MRVAEVRAQLRSILDAPFEARRFRYYAARDAYRRKFGEGDQLVHIRLVSLPSAVVLELSASVRFTEIERIFHAARGTKVSSRLHSSTLWVRAAMLRGRPKTELDPRIRTPGDVTAVANDIIQFLEREAATFFEELSSLELAERRLNGASDPERPYQAQPMRSEYGVIAAALAGRPDFTDIVAAQRTALEHIDRGFYLREFDAIVEVLASRKAERV